MSSLLYKRKFHCEYHTKSLVVSSKQNSVLPILTKWKEKSIFIIKFVYDMLMEKISMSTCIIHDNLILTHQEK